jgi:hypothetical protein
VTLNGGTANGVSYLNASKVLTTGSALAFDGTNLTLPSGNFTIGASTSGKYVAVINGDVVNAQQVQLRMSGTDAVLDATRFSGTTPNLIFQIDSSERARITSGGNLLVGTTTDNGRITVYRPSTLSGDGIVTCYSDSGSTNNIRVVLRVDGGIANYQANDTNLSDGRIKKNIELAGSYIEKICAIPVKLFNYKDENNGEQRTLGVIAQDVESVAPELIDPSGFGNTPEDGIPLKAIYQTDLQYALMKCIQEQQALIQSLTARVAALESN